MKITRDNKTVKTIKTMMIIPCVSNRSGDAVKNQYIIKFNNYYAFQSYDSLIAIYDIEKNKLVLGCDFDYSVTTLKYLHIFYNPLNGKNEIQFTNLTNIRSYPQYKNKQYYLYFG